MTTITGRKSGFTMAEMLVALVILALLLSAVAVAMQASFQNYSENTKIAQLTQTARVVLHRMMSEIRTAEAIDSDSQRVTIVPPTNPEGLTEIEYELQDGVLYCRRTVNGVKATESLICSDHIAQIVGFNVVRETGLDGEGVEYTKSVTTRLDLQAGDNYFSVSTSACPRRNIEY